MLATKSAPRPSTRVVMTASKVLDPHLPLISMYTAPPLDGPDGDGYITIRDFEQYAVDRLIVLQAIDRICALEQYIPDDDKKKALINKVLVQQGLAMSHDSVPEEVIARDQISHFIIRLAFSRNTVKREWLIKQELRLLKYRLQKTGSAGRAKLCSFPMVTVGELMENKAISQVLLQFISAFQLRKKSTLYRLPFETAAFLVSKRRTAVWAGMAYVLDEDLDTIFLSEMKEKLIKSLDSVADSPLALTGAFDDLRISEFLNMLSQMNLNPQTAAEKSTEGIERLSRSNLEVLYRRSFPPCMRVSMEHLKTQHHHKHWGRLQLRLFLKGCGMNLDEQMQMWQEFMQPKVDSDKFRKEHAYNIRHAYGQEGKRADYTPWACSKILSGSAPPNPGPGECHGCPLKLFDAQPLGKLLGDWGVSRKTIDSMLELKRNNHIQLACVEYFKGNHPGTEADGVGNHPNDFFKMSCAYHKLKAEENGEVPEEDKKNEDDVKME